MILNLVKKSSAALLICTVFSSFSANAQISEINCAYDDSHRSVSISAKGGLNESLSIAVLPCGLTLDADLINSGAAIIRSMPIKSYELSEKFSLPLNWRAGHYTIEAGGKKHCILISGGLTDNMLANLTAKEDILSLLSAANGFDKPAEIIDGAADIMSENTRKYDVNGFLKQYMISEGIVLYRNKLLTVNEFLENYALYLDGEPEQSELETFSEFLAIYKGAPENVIAECGALAKIADGSLENLQLSVLKYIEDNNLSYGDYKLLNDYYSREMWNSVYGGRKKYTSLSNLYNGFISECEKKYSEQNGQSIGGGSSSSGKGSGGGWAANPSISTDGKNTAEAKFSDLIGHWADEAVLYLNEKGIVNGVGNGYFLPDENVTRAEFAAMLVKLGKIDEKNVRIFSDVSESDWFGGVVGAAYSAEIIKGDGTLFFPNRNITREDICVMLERLLNYLGTETDAEQAVFGDNDEISEYARGAVSKMAAAGITVGYENMFRPKASATRAEAAMMVYRAYKLLKG